MLLTRLWSVGVFGLILACNCVHADMYLHSPRGSNDRLNEKSANRNNNKRLFDSQNNNRGGYNVGDATDKAAGNNAELQYQMHHFQSGPSVNQRTGNGGSQMIVEWTNQHGCGGNEDTDPQKQNCNIVLQMMCEDAQDDTKPAKMRMRDGTNTNTINYTPPGSLNDETQQQNTNRRNGNLDVARGMQESWYWYDKCYVRQRNNGLFAADQKLKKNKFGYSSAIHTRQDNNGNNRYGYECPEERDYFPYWHPTPWKDVAILAENSSMCSHYTSKSYNVQPYHECVQLWKSGIRKPYSKWNNAAECEANGGNWTQLYNFLEKAPAYKDENSCVQQSKRQMKYIWAVPYDSTDGQTPECLVSLTEPECYEAPWSRSNHLGNGRGAAEPLTYKWTLPYFPSGHEQRCVLRARYNISTDDYNPYYINSSMNGDESPVRDNKQIEVVAERKLQMALNTDQTGRTFQDRSHIFILMPRPAGLEKYQIYNLNGRGKRGNIVQTYPAVEYDFTPNHLHIGRNDLVHIQWTGSNTHNNGNPAGDGQAGDDGEGTGGTDRFNIAQIADLNENFPLPYEQTTMWQNAEIMWIEHGMTNISPKDLALGFSSSGYYRCFKETSCPKSQPSKYIVEKQQTKLNSQLNNAPASYKGAVLRFKKGTYHYMCTRNNNFTNRSHKGTIHVQ